MSKWKNKFRPTMHIFLLLNKKHVPLIFFEKISKWKGLYKSPYSDTIYSKKKDWNYTEDKTLRFSDHWNFFSHNKKHCITNKEVKNDTHWTLAEYNSTTNTYNVIFSLEKDHSQENFVNCLKFKQLFLTTNRDYVNGKKLKNMIRDKMIYGEIQLISNEMVINDKGLITKLTKSELRLINQNGEEISFKNNKRQRLTINLYDKYANNVNHLIVFN